MQDGAISFLPGENGCYSAVKPFARDGGTVNSRHFEDDILDLMHESIFTRALDGRILSWNKASEQLYGWPKEAALGRDTHEFLNTECDVGLDAAQKTLSDAGAWEGSLARQTAEGLEVVVEARWSYLRDTNGDPVAIAETGTDITERRRTEEALRLSEHRYHNLFQAMAASFWELDFSAVDEILRRVYRAGNTDFPRYFRDHPEVIREMMRATRVVDVNDETVKLFGRDGNKEELLHNVDPFWPQESNGDYIAGVLSAVSGANNYSVETKLRAIDGRVFDAHFTACYPPDTMGKGTLLIGVMDLTARNNAFAALDRMRADMAHAARVSMLGELAASIAHEVNQPLAAIATNGAAGLRWLNRPEPNLEEVRTLTDHIVSDARRAADIVARIRGMASSRAPKPVPLSLNDVVSETAQFLRHEIKAHKAELNLALARGLPMVMADRTQMQQVVVNLAMNALQALPQGPGNSRRVNIGTGLQGGEVLLTVEDSGTGIADAHLDHLFDSFFSTKEQGMGLGLPVSRSIIESAGGRIRAGAGTSLGGACFSIVLPAFGAEAETCPLA